ncbi:MAG: hypothetical protein ACE5HS_19480 [bacterium]
MTIKILRTRFISQLFLLRMASWLPFNGCAEKHKTPASYSPIKWAQVLFVFTEHLEMTKGPAFTDNLLFMLLEHPR